MGQETYSFQTEVGKLLDIVAHSLYSHKEIFLRELISNASDACDRLRFAALTDPDLIDGDSDFRILLEPDAKAKTLAVIDDGIGMNRDELVENLGTIARSGTQAFMDQLSAAKDAKEKGDKTGDDMALIGQFGVGFYSAFMVADTVEVTSRKAGEDAAWKWVSDGKGAFTVEETTREKHGTTVLLRMRKDAAEFLDAHRIRTIVQTYSDHVGFPVVLREEGKDEDTLNAGSALWTRAAKDITEEQYTEFYHHVGHAFDAPWRTLHNKVEGVLSYTNLLFIPSTPPFDLFDPDRKPRVKLYVKRVFITDDCEGLLPGWLRFVRGIVDSEDLTLNISREMLQHDPKLARIQKGLVKRILGDLKKAATKDAEGFAAFWKNFGAVLKEGIYEDFENREALLELARFRSTRGDEPVTLDDYVAAMKDGQEAIYFITGEDADTLARSPQLEGFKARGVEVLLLSDPVDEFWIPSLGTFKEKPFKSVTRGSADLGALPKTEDAEKAEKEAETPDTPGLDTLVAAVKLALGTAVKDVRVSDRLTDSPVCLVADDNDMDLRLERMLRQHRQLGADAVTPRILEINPKHALIRRMADRAAGAAADDAVLADAANLLLDQARIVEGEPVADPMAFMRRMTAIMEKGLGAA